MSNHFSQKFIEEIELKLADEKARLTQQLAQISTKSPHREHPFEARFPELGDKEDENAAEVATLSDNLTLERELEKSLRDIEGALERLNKGSYGICKYCQKPIDERRLLARPMSSACVECKKLFTQEV